ncbi:MAG TPA: VOC family protein [Ilumatobacteraceae bacterium]|nr:VOC family protein [Ilumatobacteraceae bacterium]
MAARFDLVTLDSPATDALAAFWARALDLHEVEREDGDRWIVLADGAGVRRLGVQSGMTRAGSVHLDLVCERDRFDTEVARLVGLGASVVSAARLEPYGAIVNLVDPDGNPFDLCAYS